jgi:hypothetical protein
MSEPVYLIDPPPSVEFLSKLAQHLSLHGHNLSYIGKEILLMESVKQMLLDIGETVIVSRQLLTEEVLPDKTPRAAVLDTLRYKLNRCQPRGTLLIVDPYIYPETPDPDYVADFISVFTDAITACSSLEICTIKRWPIENELDTAIKALNPRISITKKFSRVFHDRFWIADGSRGLFVGTSFNGLGKRYAVVDYLTEEDAKDIYQRYSQIP